MATRPPLSGSVLITGASAGLGVAFARQFAQTASTLVLVARRLDRLESLAAELRAARADLRVLVWPCDLGDRAAVMALGDRVIAELGGVDVLVNNAGFGDQNFVEHAEDERLVQMIAVNVLAPTLLCRRLVPGMVARGRGGVLNVSSGFGIAYLPGFAAYGATKQYMTGFSDALRAELAGTGVVVTQVLPGPVSTEFHEVARGTVPVVPPGVAMIDAARCVGEALRGFSRGQAMVIPGRVFWLVAGLGRITPRWLYRPIAEIMGRRMRVKIQARLSASAQVGGSA